ncbi:class I SAM-dependent methyltransferase [Legionella jamestowniensis]|uniref:class I SAM-dependent methyltransferase n=1 Tax=Legionella jamestowniensis TaxID=455 RepID=UPI00159EFE7C
MGCGEGNLCHWISSYFNYYGVDYSEEYLTHARKLYEGRGEFINLISALPHLRYSPKVGISLLVLG